MEPQPREQRGNLLQSASTEASNSRQEIAPSQAAGVDVETPRQRRYSSRRARGGNTRADHARQQKRKRDSPEELNQPEGTTSNEGSQRQQSRGVIRSRRASSRRFSGKRARVSNQASSVSIGTQPSDLSSKAAEAQNPPNQEVKSTEAPEATGSRKSKVSTDVVPVATAQPHNMPDKRGSDKSKDKSSGRGKGKGKGSGEGQKPRDNTSGSDNRESGGRDDSPPRGRGRSGYN